MATTVKSVLDKASILLHDTSRIRWTWGEQVGWLNDGQQALASIAPISCAKKVSHPVTYPNSRISLPADGISLISVNYNMGSAGTSYGKAIRLIDRELLDSRYPDWHSMTGSEITGYVYNPATPTSFFVWPKPASGSLYVELDYVALPPTLTTSENNTTDGIGVPDHYAEALINYVVFRAHSKDTEAQAAEKATLYYQAFVNSAKGAGGMPIAAAPEATPTNTVLNPNSATHYAGR